MNGFNPLTGIRSFLTYKVNYHVLVFNPDVSIPSRGFVLF